MVLLKGTLLATTLPLVRGLKVVGMLLPRAGNVLFIVCSHCSIAVLSLAVAMRLAWKGSRGRRVGQLRGAQSFTRGRQEPHRDTAARAKDAGVTNVSAYTA